MDEKAREIRDYYENIAPYLDEELAERGDEQFWKELVSQRESCQVLELGSGTGRITKILAACSGEVLALDLSPEMIRRSARKLADCPLVGLVLADMRRLPFRKRFDLVIAADDPFVHLTREEDRHQALVEAAAHLKAAGSFLLDAFWLPKRKLRRARRSGYEKKRTSDPEGAQPLRIEEEWECETDRLLCRASYRYRRGEEVILESEFAGRLWTEEEIRDRFPRVGLQPIRFYGNYAGEPWDPGSSDHLIVEAGKRGRRS